MSSSLARLSAAGIALLLATGPLIAQRPTADEARALLQSNPDLVAQLRSKLSTSGLTPEQVRARLRAEGYPENLLDPYLEGSSLPAGAQPDPAVYDAMRALGVADSLEMSALQRMPPDVEEDEVICDTIRGALPRVDSLKGAPAEGPPDSTWLDRERRAPTSATPPRLVCRPTRWTVVGSPDSGFTIFGSELFSRRTTQFQPNLAGPVDRNYRLGPGDRLVLILTGDVETAHVLDVTREGFVVIPQVGQLPVANLTMAQLEDLLYTRLGRVYSGVKRGPGATTHFSVSVARLRTNQVFVVGDVKRPGSYRVSSAGTALTALYAAGGPTENGSLRRVEIRRGGQVVDVLDVYDYLLRGDASHDARLESGDVVFVPVHGPRVRIVGEVVRPATYELKEGETLADLIRAAGGYKPTASRTRVQIERILPPAQREPGGRDRVVMDVTVDARAAAGGDGAKGADGAALALPVVAGDVVRIFPITERVRNRIHVLGDVWQPGAQGYVPGMRLSEAIQRAGGTKPDAYLGQILVTRTQPDSTRVQLRASFRDSTGAVVDDIPLQEDDEIRVFSVAEFRPQRYVSIAGAVRKSGRVAYREGMTLRDLVLLAGGLEEGAYLNEAEIARLPENRAAGATARTIRVPLDSSYLVERRMNGEYHGPPGLPAPNGPAPEVKLEPYDNVLILRQPDWELQRTVVVTGEVRFPGRYTLRNKQERLADVIERAGGLTASAYPGGIVFVRQRGGLGRIGVDLPRVLANSRFSDNLILQDGDSIHIPTYSGVVIVQGAVNAPGTVAYVRGANLDYYVSAAGGASRKADMKRAYVTQPNGKVESVHRQFLLPDAVPKPGPGGVVVVPEREAGQQSPFLASLPIVSSIVGSLVALTAILLR
jgi:protein involved in polysaccharide export with SLBB domain